MKNPDIPTNL